MAKRTSRGTSGSSSGGSEGRSENARSEAQQDLLPDEGERELLEFEDSATHRAVIKVVGCGGGGGNALNNMVRSGLAGVDFIAANTDAQALQHNLAPIKVQLGGEVTRGLGCGADPNKGRESALEVRDRLREAFVDTDMVFVTAGLGGGTGRARGRFERSSRNNGASGDRL